VGLAIALVKNPAVLLLDEPWASVDPVGARDLAAVLRARSARGPAVVLTAHDLVRARMVPTRIGILARGCLVVELAAHGLSDAELEQRYLEAASGPPARPSTASSAPQNRRDASGGSARGHPRLATSARAIRLPWPTHKMALVVSVSSPSAVRSSVQRQCVALIDPRQEGTATLPETLAGI
jgi:ABC-type multidrug transport system ATPase subunit